MVDGQEWAYESRGYSSGILDQEGAEPRHRICGDPPQLRGSVYRSRGGLRAPRSTAFLDRVGHFILPWF